MKREEKIERLTKVLKMLYAIYEKKPNRSLKKVIRDVEYAIKTLKSVE